LGDLIPKGGPDSASDALAQLASVRRSIQRARELIGSIDTAPEGIFLVRQARAKGKVLEEALRTCATLESEQFDVRFEAAELHLRTQRRTGELLSAILKNHGGRPKTDSKPEGVLNTPPTLRQLGINAHESHIWQQIASIPQERFERAIDRTRTQRAELTTSRFILLAKRLATRRGDSQEEGADREAGVTHHEFDRFRKSAAKALGLNTGEIAAAMTENERKQALDDIDRLRTWLAEVERAIGHKAEEAT
jgi:hypothetical protein